MFCAGGRGTLRDRARHSINMIALLLAVSAPTSAFLVPPTPAPRAVAAARAPSLRMATDWPQLAKYPVATAGQVTLEEVLAPRLEDDRPIVRAAALQARCPA